MPHHPFMATTCVVVPAYREAAVIAGVVATLVGRFGEVVVVDDGSRDATGDLAAAAGATVLRHPVNLGQGAALQTGFEYAAQQPWVTHVLTFDADGQHHVDDAVAAVELAGRTGVDLVLGSRFLEESDPVPALRRIVLRAGVVFSRWTTGLELTDTHNGLRVLSRRAIASLRLRHHGMAHASEILEVAGREGWSYREVPARVHYSDYSVAKGQSSLNAVNVLLDLAVDRIRGRAAA